MEFHFHHHHDFSRQEATTRRIESKVDNVSQQLEQLMGLADDLNNGMTSLATGFAALDKAIHDEISNVAQEPGLSDSVKQALVNISTLTSNMATDAAQLTARIPAATTVPTPPTQETPIPNVQPTVEPVVLGSAPITDTRATPTSTPPDSSTTQSV